MKIKFLYRKNNLQRIFYQSRSNTYTYKLKYTPKPTMNKLRNPIFYRGPEIPSDTTDSDESISSTEDFEIYLERKIKQRQKVRPNLRYGLRRKEPTPCLKQQETNEQNELDEKNPVFPATDIRENSMQPNETDLSALKSPSEIAENTEENGYNSKYPGYLQNEEQNREIFQKTKVTASESFKKQMQNLRISLKYGKGPLAETRSFPKLNKRTFTKIYNQENRMVYKHLMRATGNRYPTPVQTFAAAMFFRNQDCILSAPTGTGKTLSYVLPLLTLSQRELGLPEQQTGPLALIIIPTRELAIQVTHVFNSIISGSALAMYGGIDKEPDSQFQKTFTKGIESKSLKVIVSTAGRAYNSMRNKQIDATQLKYIILDEADVLLTDQSLVIKQIFNYLKMNFRPSPEKHQANLAKIDYLCSKFVKNGSLSPDEQRELDDRTRRGMHRKNFMMYSATFSTMALILANEFLDDDFLYMSFAFGQETSESEQFGEMLEQQVEQLTLQEKSETSNRTENQTLVCNTSNTANPETIENNDPLIKKYLKEIEEDELDYGQGISWTETRMTDQERDLLAQIMEDLENDEIEKEEWMEEHKRRIAGEKEGDTPEIETQENFESISKIDPKKKLRTRKFPFNEDSTSFFTNYLKIGKNKEQSSFAKNQNRQNTFEFEKQSLESALKTRSLNSQNSTKNSRKNSANDKIIQEVLMVYQREKYNRLSDVIFESDVDFSKNEKILIFVNQRRQCTALSCMLAFDVKISEFVRKQMTIKKDQLFINQLHSDMTQQERETAEQDFRSGHKPILVATDVAARGLDAKDVALVIQYDLPTCHKTSTPDIYIHRRGRTGRAGNVGRCISFFDPDKDERMLRALNLWLMEDEKPDFIRNFQIKYKSRTAAKRNELK